MRGGLNHQKYVDIANSFDKGEGHVKDTGYELLQMLSDIFEEPVKKGNFKSVLERQRDINFNISDGNNGSIANVINCVNFNSDRPSSSQSQTPLEKTSSPQNKQIPKIKKLKDLGLTSEEIAELLEILLDLITGINLKETA